MTSKLTSQGIMIISTPRLNCCGYSSIQQLSLRFLICISLVLDKEASHLSIPVILSISTCCHTVAHFQLCSRPQEVSGNEAGKNACPLSLSSRVSTWSHAVSAKSLQSCPTLCDPIDESPPGSPVPGILQPRTLEWGAIVFSTCCLCWFLSLLLLGFAAIGN